MSHVKLSVKRMRQAIQERLTLTLADHAVTVTCDLLFDPVVCRCPSDTGPFVLRAWAPCCVALEQLPSPYSLTHGGQWFGSSAGGSRAQTTWASNPHYLLTSRREATALLCLQRPDVCNSLLPQPYDPSGCISLTVCQPVAATAAAKAGTPAVVAAQSLVAAAAAATGAAGSKVVGSTDYSSMDRAVLMVKLMPDTPYVLVPSTVEPGEGLRACCWQGLE
jgi:hypothetical protein